MDNFEYKTDKSWGVVGLSRVHGVDKKLFGSDVITNDAVVLRIKQAEKSRSLHKTWVCGKTDIVEVILTPNQFAEMITLMNVGDGVPCTIRFTQKDGFIDFKEEENKLDLIISEREKHIDNAFNGLEQSIEKINQLIESKKISKTVGCDLVDNLEKILNEINGKGREFINKQAKTEIEKMVVEAKQNIQSYVDYKIYQTGLENIKEVSNKLLED